MLPHAGALRLMQGGKQADDAEQRRAQVGKRNTDAHGGIARRARRHHRAAKGLDDSVHRLTGALALASESRNRAVQQARIDAVHVRVACAQTVEHTPAEVFDEHVGLLDELLENRSGLRVLHVQGHGLLVAQAIDGGDRDVIGVLAREVRPVWTYIGSVGAAGIGARRVFDLDDASAQAGKKERGIGPGQRRG